MNKNVFFFKQLTAAEVGEKGTHEVYVRLPNDFNHEEFFRSTLEEKNGVLEKMFVAKNLTKGHEADEPLTLRFAYFVNSNKEKRIPSLGELFKANDVHENDIVRLESRSSDKDTAFYITFHKPDELQLSPKQFYYAISKDLTDYRKFNELPASLQRIYYGAPGTGKSHKVKEIAERDQDHFVRTTFHPDSDYSTFVGAYKPTVKQEPRYTSLGEKAIKMKGANGEEIMEDRIVYEFVPQAFLQAYIEAWKSYPTPEFLVIEEINRGNCAQIFGDLFQLLDRNENGFSDYYINADSDTRKHLSEEFSKFKDKFDEEKKDEINIGCKRDVVNKILTGEIMLIPSNLYILATMNTSDQSLFPIDSAFKRRWDWVYVPIAKGVDRKSGEEFRWKIVVGTKEYDWWNFLEKINEQIGATTNSEDKKLGFFFCMGDADGVIDAETFVSKVLFYLWNDVFKDYGFDGELFRATDGNPLTFDKFYNVMRGEAMPNVDNVQFFLENLGVKGPSKDSIEGVGEKEEAHNEDKQDDKGYKYFVNNNGINTFSNIGSAVIEEFIKKNEAMNSEQVCAEWKNLKIKRGPFIKNKIEYDKWYSESSDRYKENRYVEIPVKDSFVYVKTDLEEDDCDKIMQKVNQQDWGIHIEKVK